MANEFKIYGRKLPGSFVNGVTIPIQGKTVTREELTVATEIKSAIVNLNTDYVQLKTSLACHYLIGVNPTAAADSTSTFLGVGEITEEPIEQGEQISVIAG